MRVEVNGVRLYYEILGDPSDPPVVVFHGGPGLGDHRKGKETYRPLVEEGFQLVVYDHRGCGRSEQVPPYTNAQFAEDAETIRQALELGSISVIGGSYGGFITQEYAIRYQDHLDAMVFRGTAARSEHREEARRIAESRIPAVREATLETPPISKAAFEREMEGNLNSDEDFRRTFHSITTLYAPSIDEFDADATEERIDQLTFNHEVHNAIFSDEHPTIDYTPQLPMVDVPALVTVGAEDWIAPPSYSRELAELLPQAELEVFENAGHSPNVDRPDAFLSRVRDFLQDIYYSE